MQVELALLGPMKIVWNGEAVAIGSAAARALIAYLALEADRPHARERLAALMWPDSNQAAAFMSLRQVLVRTRQALPDPGYSTMLDVTQHTLRFRSEGATVDVWRFEELLTACATHQHAHITTCDTCIQRLEEAAALYRGELMPGMFLKSSQAWEEWLFFKRESLHRKALFVLHTLTEAAEAAADYDRMQGFAQRQIELEPWREEAYRQLMRAFAFIDDRSGALATYETCRRVLDQELGVEPATETTALRDQIRQGRLRPIQPAPPTSTTPTLALPVPPTPLVGRTDELVMVVERLRDRHCRMATLTGPGGVGKTHLAMEAARMLVPSFEDGVVFVALGAVTDPTMVISTIAHTLGVHSIAGQSVLEGLASAIQHKRMLVVLDNFEQVIAATAAIGELLAFAPSLHLLVTSRTALRMRAEHEIVIAPLTLPVPRTPLGAASGNAAVTLFVQRAQAIAPTFTLDNGNIEAVIEICRRLDGLPLALELAAARVKTLPPPMLSRRLNKRLDLLTNGMKDLPDRYQTLRSTIDWSYQLLGTYEQRLFGRLAIFVGGCTVEAAEAICADANDAPMAVLDGLQTLVDHSLIRQIDGEDGALRFVMLETIREYASERLSASGEEERLRAAHARFYEQLAAQAAPQLAGGAEQIAWFAHVGAELDNIRAVLRWALERRDGVRVLEIGVALREFWMTRAHLREGRQWLEAALQLDQHASSGIDDVLRGNAYSAAGWLAANARDYRGAEALFEQSLAMARRTEDAHQIIAMLGVMGQAARMQGDAQRALNLYEESVLLSRAEDDKRGVAWGLCNLGIIAHGAGDNERAATFLQEGVAAADVIGDLICRAWCQTFLARVAKDHHDDEQATTIFQDTLTLFDEVGHTDGIAFTLEGCAGFCLARGDATAAATIFGAAEALREAINRPQPPDTQDLAPDDPVMRTEAWRTAWGDGRTQSMEQAIRYAIEHIRLRTTYAQS